MRDLLFKNMTSIDKRKRVLSSSETSSAEGVRSVVHRHFIWLLKEAKQIKEKRPMPCLYVLKKCDSKGHKEKFYCKLKGCLYVIRGKKLYQVLFMHSLQIHLTNLEYTAS